MVEHVSVKPLPACRQAIEILDLVDIVKATEPLLHGIDSISLGRDKAVVIYIWRPDEFTKKRIKTKIKMVKKSDSAEIEIRGGFEMDIVLTCTETGEVVIVLTVHKKGSKYITEEKLHKVADNIYKTLRNLVA